ncbi:hypothetical protein V5O48_006270 [Marasmius crinis-equi]|uniref:FAD-binding domain-containing protein n=1 Tax=Marasmius crinis-equi TaxID=585013 RepID=A0ABR3FK81_9AGAR
MPIPLPRHAKILIVGAGPAGLATGLSLIKHGVNPQDIVVVNRVAQAENTSRAIVIHSATLEALDSLGCAEDLVSRAVKGTRFQMQSRSGTPLFGLRFSSLDSYTKFPFFLIIPQNITEQVLEKHAKALGIKIHSPYTVVGMKTSESGEGLDVSFESGDVVSANFVVGADGARSVIRQLAGIDFMGSDGAPLHDDSPTESLQSVIADVSLSSPPPSNNTLYATLSDGALCILAPFEDSHGLYKTDQPIHRLVFLSNVAPPSQPPLEVLQKYVDDWAPFMPSSDQSYRISEVYWSSRFRHRSAAAATFYKKLSTNGRIFLVGDAAHIHSPAGGQGMNLGLRDAVGLGAIIGGHFGADDFDEALEKHAVERRGRAVKTIGLTNTLLAGARNIMSNSFVYWALKTLLAIPFVQGAVVWRLSGLGNR